MTSGVAEQEARVYGVSELSDADVAPGAMMVLVLDENQRVGSDLVVTLGEKKIGVNTKELSTGEVSNYRIVFTQSGDYSNAQEVMGKLNQLLVALYGNTSDELAERANNVRAALASE